MDRKARQEAIEKLSEKYQTWLVTVDLLITDEEIATFLALDKDYQRDAFIKRFWAARNTYKSTARNEFQDRWEANVELALATFEQLDDDRARILLLNGAPADPLEAALLDHRLARRGLGLRRTPTASAPSSSWSSTASGEPGRSGSGPRRRAGRPVLRGRRQRQRQP